MNSVAVSRFRSDILFFLKKVMQGEEISITARGKDVAMLVPPQNKMKKARATLKQLQKSCKVGDVLSPLAVSWKAIK